MEKHSVHGGGGRVAAADAPRRVDTRRLPAERRLLALHSAWLPRGAPLALPLPPLVLTIGPPPPPPPGLSPPRGGGGTPTLLADLSACWARASSVNEPSAPDDIKRHPIVVSL